MESVTKTALLIFGTYNRGVENFTQDIRTLLQKKGVEFDGPVPLPRTPVEEMEIDLSDEELEHVKGRTFCKKLIVIYRGDGILKQIMTMDVPDGVFLRMEVRPYIGQSKGKNAPYSYDPHWRV